MTGKAPGDGSRAGLADHGQPATGDQPSNGDQPSSRDQASSADQASSRDQASKGGQAAGPGRADASRRALAAAGLGAACISASAVLVVLAHTGPATTAFYRCFLALPLLILLAIAEQRRLGPRLPRARLAALAAGGFLAADLVLWNHAIADVGAGIATVLGNLQVLFVMVAAWVLLRERPPRSFLIGLPVVMAGVALVSGLAGAGTGDTHPVAGIVFGVCTSAAYAAFLLIMRQSSTGARHIAGPLSEATIGAAAGALLLGLAFGGLRLDVPWESLRWLLLLSVTSQTVGWLLITSSLPRLPAAMSSLLLLLQPVAALALAAAVLGQRPSLSQAAGVALVCGGVLAISRATAPARRQVAAPPPPQAGGPVSP